MGQDINMVAAGRLLVIPEGGTRAGAKRAKCGVVQALAEGVPDVAQEVEAAGEVDGGGAEVKAEGITLRPSGCREALQACIMQHPEPYWHASCCTLT